MVGGEIEDACIKGFSGGEEAFLVVVEGSSVVMLGDGDDAGFEEIGEGGWLDFL